jgi:hypothetical protein
MRPITTTRSFLFLLLLSGLTLNGCSQDKKEGSHKLVRLWESEANLTTCESVCYDPRNNLLYVACINGQPGQKDGNGFIATLSIEGNEIDKEWVKGLDAPKGMAITGDNLYVTDIDRVVEINRRTGAITQSIPIAGAQFLNDLTASPEGNLYVSDMATNKVHLIRNGQVSLLLENPVLESVNGLFFEEDGLLIGCKNALYRYHTGDKSVETVLKDTPSIDGIEKNEEGNIIFSDWIGHVFRTTGKTFEMILDLSGENKNAADIEVVPDLNLLLVPTFRGNSVIAFRLTSP